MTTKVLRLIGKGQVTVPQEWRAVLGLEGKIVKATLQGNKMLIEALPLEEDLWDLELIQLNALAQSDSKIVQDGRKAYKSGQREKFLNAHEFFKD